MRIKQEQLRKEMEARQKQMIAQVVEKVKKE